MQNITIYTAVGRLEMHSEPNQPPFPTVILRGKEYYIDRQELLLWGCLNWRLLKKGQVGLHYEKLAITASYISCRSWEQCLNRLLLRGLVIEGSGDTEYDALYDLLAPLNIVPIGGGLFARLFSFAKLTLWNNVPLSTASRLLKPDQRNDCVDQGIYSVSSTDAVVEQLYNDESTTSLNLPCLAKTDLNCRRVISAIANLYLRQQIIFDCV